MKKGNIAALSIIVIFVGLLAIPLITLEDVPVIDVTAVINVTDGSSEIKNVTLEQQLVNPLKAPGGNSNAGFPGVEAKAMVLTERGWAKLSYWAAVDYRGDGTYHLVIGFPKDARPEQGDMVKVIVGVVDETGKPLAIDYARVIIWEG